MAETPAAGGRTAACACGQLRIEVQGAPLAVAVGAFGDPAFPPPTDSVYDSRRHAWVQLPPGVRTHDKDPDLKR